MNLLFLSTTSCILEYIAPIFIKYLTNHFYSRTKHDVELQNELINLKQEMANISMVDEFSKYAKLQRKYNKLTNILTDTVNKRLYSRTKVQLSVTYAFRIINSIMMLALLYFYKTEPVVILPKGILWPIQNILSWPSHYEDSISLIMWLLIARLVVSTCKKIDMLQ